MHSIRWITLAFAVSLGLPGQGATDKNFASVRLEALDMERIAAEDTARSDKSLPQRFAIPRDVSVIPGRDGSWVEHGSGRSTWTFTIQTPDAVHLNFGFTKFFLPPSSSSPTRVRNWNMGASTTCPPDNAGRPC